MAFWLNTGRIAKMEQELETLRLRERFQAQTAGTDPVDLRVDMTPARPRGVIIPFPRARVPKVEAPPDEMLPYEEQAREIGFWPAQLTLIRLRNFFAREGVEIFDNDDVDRWLMHKAKEARQDTWCWRALREKDIIEGFGWHIGEGNKYRGFYSSSNWRCRVYDRLVPIEVLRQISKIEKEFGDRAKFFVSDFATARPDPFAMVRTSDPAPDSPGDPNHCIIFAMWDEPGFKAFAHHT